MSSLLFFNLNGIANGAPRDEDQPTIRFENLPFGFRGQLPESANVTGKVVGVDHPEHYRVALFAKDESGFVGQARGLAEVAADGSFQVATSRSQAIYVAQLVTPELASSFYAPKFSSGEAILHDLPSPAERPGAVLMSREVPAGLGRTLVARIGRNEEAIRVGPQAVWNDGFQYADDIRTANGPDPTNPREWPMMWIEGLSGRRNWSLSYVLGAETSTGQPTKGALQMSLWAYKRALYFAVGYGPARDQDMGSIQPEFVVTPVEKWLLLAPSVIQIGCTATILSDQVLFTVECTGTKPSELAIFLKAVGKLSKKIFGVLFSLV